MGIDKIQEFLQIPVTGEWDKATVQEAVKFQKKHNLKESGLPTQELKDVMQSLLDRKEKAKKRKQKEIRHPKNKPCQ